LAFDGRVHHFEQGYWLKFEIGRVEPTPERPHGLRYAFTLHDGDGNRLIGFDNAHRAAPLGSRFRPAGSGHDHWHRSGDDPGRPYAFTTAEQLLADFFTEVRRVLAERGISDDVVSTSDRRPRSKP
jgi:hypothetical protein